MELVVGLDEPWITRCALLPSTTIDPEEDG